MAKVVLPRVRAYQVGMVESGARFKLVMCGRRWGKSKVGLVAACDGHGPRRGHFRGALQGARIGWIVPSEQHPAAAEVWSDLKAALGPAAQVGGRVSEEQRLIVVPGGGSVQVWSGHDPDRLRGPYFDGVVVDECSIQDARVWAALRPTLSDYGGWGMVCGTVPEDVSGHWFVLMQHYATSMAGKARGWQAWRLPSWENPQLTKGDVDEARETLGTRAFLREYGAELVGVSGGVWKEEWFRERYWRELPPVEARRKWVIALDAAWKTGVRNDYSSAQLWVRTATEYFLVDELYGKWESPELRRRVSAFRQAWLQETEERGMALPLYVEEAGGGVVAVQEFVAQADVPVLGYAVKSSTKMARSEAVSPLAESGKVWLPHPERAPWVTAYVNELVGFPDLPHDDRCDATSMALQLLRTGVEAARAVLRPSLALRQHGGYA